jgi:hypothetical protein
MIHFSSARWSAAVLLFGLTAATILPSHQAAAADKLDDRIHLHRVPSRGMEYVATSHGGASTAAKSSLSAKVELKIDLDGDPLLNVYSSVLPLDYNGNGTTEFLHWNGHRVMRLYGQAGNKLWQINNGSGRRLTNASYIHRDGAAILDLNGDGKEDVLHCWQSGSQKLLIARNGVNGKEIRRVSVSDQINTETSWCKISVYRKQSDKQPIVLLAARQAGGSAKCDGKNYIDNWTRVIAYTTELKKLWHTDICHAGHQSAGVDANNDGYQEYFFIGKYGLDFNGKIRCSLKGWSAKDHVDAVRVARLDPNSSRMVAVAVGATGGGAFDASNCKWLWGFSKTIKNPQELSIAQLDPAPKPLSVTVTQRGSEPNAKTYVLNASGKIVRTIGARIIPMQNAQLDGNGRTDEILAMFGEVFNGSGKQLLSRNWYWNLKGSKVKTVPSSNVYDHWAAFPLLVDVDKDGRDEMVVWGQSLIVTAEIR